MPEARQQIHDKLYRPPDRPKIGGCHGERFRAQKGGSAYQRVEPTLRGVVNDAEFSRITDRCENGITIAAPMPVQCKHLGLAT